MGVLAVVGGDDRIARAPDDQHRHALGEVEAVAGVDALAAGADDRAQRGQEGGPAVGVGRATRSRGRPRRRPAFGRSADGREAAPERRSDAPAAPAVAAMKQVGAGQRRRAQDRADLRAEAAAGDEHEPLDHLGELVGELHRDPAAERVADERRALVAERERADRAGRRRAPRASSRRRRGADPPCPGRSGAMTVWCRASGSITSCQFSEVARHPVDQQQDGALARLGVGHRPAVERQRPDLDRAHADPIAPSG